jgi:hypothetical protein
VGVSSSCGLVALVDTALIVALSIKVASVESIGFKGDLQSVDDISVSKRLNKLTMWYIWSIASGNNNLYVLFK